MNSAELVKLLADAGADPSITNNEGQLAVDTTKDKATLDALATATKNADVVRSAWSSTDLTARAFDVKSASPKDSLRIRFSKDGTFSAEGDINGAYKNFSGNYTKGAQTLLMDSP